MIDIHNHILPGIDDGSESIEESIELAKAAVSEGIHTIIATPHHGNGRYINEADQVREAVSKLQETLDRENIPLTIQSGQEIRVYDRLIEDYQDGKLLTLGNSKYILLEFPSSTVPRDIENLLHELSILGLTAIIAHPERNMEVAKNPDKLKELIHLGALSQVTTHSINGLFGKKIQETALKFCQLNLVHFLSSDAHNMSTRAYGLKESIELCTQKLDLEMVNYYQLNSFKVLKNEDINPLTIKIQPKKRFQFWKIFT